MSRWQHWIARGRSWLTDPIVHGEALQMAKAALAAVAAWALAREVLQLQMSYVAPWTALLTVHATVYRSLSRGLQQVIGILLGVVLAFAVGMLVGIGYATLAFAILLGLSLGRLRFVRDEGTAVATTALIVLTTGYSRDGGLLVERLIDSALGVATGIVVNLIVVPPLAERSLSRKVHRMGDAVGELLIDIGRQVRGGFHNDDVRAWIERTRDLDWDLGTAWRSAHGADEGLRFNPRRWLPWGKRDFSARRDGERETLRHLEQTIAEVRSLARTLGHNVYSAREWDEDFRGSWVRMVIRIGNAVCSPDPHALQPVEARLQDLAGELAERQLRGTELATYGALLIGLRNIVRSMDPVARFRADGAAGLAEPRVGQPSARD